MPRFHVDNVKGRQCLAMVSCLLRRLISVAQSANDVDAPRSGNQVEYLALTSTLKKQPPKPLRSHLQTVPALRPSRRSASSRGPRSRPGWLVDCGSWRERARLRPRRARGIEPGEAKDSGCIVTPQKTQNLLHVFSALSAGLFKAAKRAQGQGESRHRGARAPIPRVVRVHRSGKQVP